jgi:hypothetical protein
MESETIEVLAALFVFLIIMAYAIYVQSAFCQAGNFPLEKSPLSDLNQVESGCTGSTTSVQHYGVNAPANEYYCDGNGNKV